MTLSSGAHYRMYLDRERDVFLSFGDPSGLHRDLDLHHLASGISYDPFRLQLVRDGLSALALYMVSRPRFETFGWTINLQDPLTNLFFTGSARESSVVGRAFLENVEPGPRNLFYAQTLRPMGQVQTSSVEVEGTDVFRIVEQYCERSDQQPVRFFSREGTGSALLCALPDVDVEWFRALESDEVFALEGSGDLKLIAEREVALRCGCDADRITSILVKLYGEEPEELFRGDPAVEAECPRCGTKHEISRAMFDGAAGARS